MDEQELIDELIEDFTEMLGIHGEEDDVEYLRLVDEYTDLGLSVKEITQAYREARKEFL